MYTFHSKNNKSSRRNFRIYKDIKVQEQKVSSVRDGTLVSRPLDPKSTDCVVILSSTIGTKNFVSLGTIDTSGDIVPCCMKYLRELRELIVLYVHSVIVDINPRIIIGFL